MTGNTIQRLRANQHASTMTQGLPASSCRLLTKIAAIACLLVGNLSVTLAAETNRLESVDVIGLAGNKTQIVLTMSKPAATPLSFTIDNPARIAFDFPETSNGLQQRTQNIGVGMTRSLTAIEAQGRTRVVINLTEMVPYEAHAEGNKIIITIQGSGKAISATASAANSASSALENVDFRRGEDGQGRIIVTLTDPSIPVDMQQQDGKIVVDFYRAALPDELERRLDVLDFATPVKTIDTYREGNNVHMVITPLGDYEHLAFQSGNQFVIEVREITPEEIEERKKDEFGYSGERLSLNFQDIEVRSVLQLIADFTGFNIVVSDTVRGSLTLRLKNVPWDQALDIILKTKGLAMRQTGNVMLVAPSEEIAAREKLELESQKQIEELEPLYSEFIQINYAKATDIAALLQSKDTSLMSDRASIATDARTNTILLQETASKLTEIRQLIAKLDIPVRQVLIKSRIVIANNDFTRDLGARIGFAGGTTLGGDSVLVGSGGIAGTDSMINDANSNLNSGLDPFPVGIPSLANRLAVNLPVVASTGRFALSLLDNDYLLDLELTAMQREGKGEVISSPRVITSNAQTALIEAGTEIPYQEASSSGATSVSFKSAVLKLEVTPQITPDDNIIMELVVSKDSVGQIFQNVPSIDTRNIETTVLVRNGQTLVLGGIYEQTLSDEVDKVPFLGDIPLLGFMFKQTRHVDERAELLIFVTPQIVKEEMNIR